MTGDTMSWMGPPAAVMEFGKGQHSMMRSKVSPFESLPGPLTRESVPKILDELAAGTKRAVETCLDCWKDKRLSNDDLLSFLRSISLQSPTLSTLFNEKVENEFEVASADDMAELMALSELGSFGSFGAAAQMASAPQPVVPAPALPMPEPIQKADQPAGPVKRAAEVVDAFPSYKRARTEPSVAAIVLDEVHVADKAHLSAVAKAPASKRTRRPKITEPTEEESRLMKEWSVRRVSEIARRWNETSGASVNASDSERKSCFLRLVIAELRNVLPSQELAVFLDHVRRYNHSVSSAEEFGEYLFSLVDKYSVVLPLTHQPEVNVRIPKKRISYSSLEEIESVPAEGEESEVAAPVVRHSHTHTCSSGRVTCEDDEDNARCPVCVGSSIEDERWVKCDGCSTWYHQICVLFNELSHGKSVRFFCRTPGCRKRGSRQLNRRQRKPCYPMSVGLDTCPMGEALGASALTVARQDRSVVARVVACESKNRGNERVKTKTVMAFQHTMTGSDLLFMTVLLEEHGNRMEITHYDCNGMYEEAYDGECAAVEGALLEGLVLHARDTGFNSVRICSVAANERSLFFNRAPSSGWKSTQDADAAWEKAVSAARYNGAVRSVHNDGQGVVIELRATNSVKTESPDMACKVALGRDAIMSLMKSNDYRFDNLQTAKFSSMMVVYHLAKGWRKDTHVPAPHVTTRHKLPAVKDVDEEDLDEDDAGSDLEEVKAEKDVKDEPVQAVFQESIMAASPLQYPVSEEPSPPNTASFDTAVPVQDNVWNESCTNWMSFPIQCPVEGPSMSMDLLGMDREVSFNRAPSSENSVFLRSTDGEGFWDTLILMD